MKPKKLNRIFGHTVFVLSLAAYIKTISPTTVFLDVGEFCAAAFKLQMPHTPGTPPFQLLSRLSLMIPIIGEQGVDGFIGQLNAQIGAKRNAQDSANAARDSVGSGKRGN